MFMKIFTVLTIGFNNIFTIPTNINNKKTTAQLVRNKREDNKIYDFEIKDLQKVRFHFGDRVTWPTTRLIEVNIKKEDNINLNEKLPEFKNLNDFTFKFIQSEFSNNKNKQDEIRQLITTYGTKVGKKE
ncbi:hypothetical protein [Spiroplasma endosymbiont of Tipula paludosa]